MRQVVCGLIGPSCASQARTRWNELFREKNIPAFFDFYRTKTKEDLELRLSEMFLLERRGYVMAPELQTMIVPLLDRLDDTAKQTERVDTVVNDGGVLVGYSCGSDEKRLAVWFSGTMLSL